MYFSLTDSEAARSHVCNKRRGAEVGDEAGPGNSIDNARSISEEWCVFCSSMMVRIAEAVNPFVGMCAKDARSNASTPGRPPTIPAGSNLWKEKVASAQACGGQPNHRSTTPIFSRIYPIHTCCSFSVQIRISPSSPALAIIVGAEPSVFVGDHFTQFTSTFPCAFSSCAPTCTNILDGFLSSKL